MSSSDDIITKLHELDLTTTQDAEAMHELASILIGVCKRISEPGYEFTEQEFDELERILESPGTDYDRVSNNIEKMVWCRLAIYESLICIDKVLNPDDYK